MDNKLVYKVTIDMSPTIMGQRAISQCTHSLVSEFLKFEEFDSSLLFLGNIRDKVDLKELHNYQAQQQIVNLPYRLLVPLWKNFRIPSVENLVGKCDLFYTNSFYFPPSKKAIVVATVHGLAYKAIPDRLPKGTVTKLNRAFTFLKKNADYFIAVSETTKTEMVEYEGICSDLIYTVTHGVHSQYQILGEKQAARDAIQKQYNINRPYILFVGAIGKHKNILGLLKAYEVVIRELNYDLLMVGPPDNAWNDAQSFINRKGLKRYVKMVGPIFDKPKLCQIYNGADLFVYPSFYEGWTSPPMEAMACGTPVIASNRSSIPETVGKAAILVDPENILEMADEMKRALTETTLIASMIDKGIEHVKRHTWERAAHKLFEIFLDIHSRGK